MPRQPSSRSACPAACFSQVRERSPVIANGRPSASLVCALSHGLARFQSKLSNTISAATGMMIRPAATASAIFVRRGLSIAESYHNQTAQLRCFHKAPKLSIYTNCKIKCRLYDDVHKAHSPCAVVICGKYVWCVVPAACDASQKISLYHIEGRGMPY